MGIGINKNAKKNGWYYEIELGKDACGKRKKKKVRGFKTEKEAKKAYVEAQNAVNKGLYQEESKICYGDYLIRYLEDKKTTVRPSTYKTYEWLLRLYIIPSLGKYQISKITARLIQDLLNNLVAEAKISKENIRKVHTLISNSLKRAEKWGEINKNHALLVDKPKVTKKEMKVWNKEQTLTFLHEAKKDQLYIAYYLAATCGMRQGEILGLRWKDVDFINGYIYVTQTLNHDGKGFSSVTKTSAGTRKIDITNQIKDELAKQKRRIDLGNKHIHAELWKENDLVVCTSFGTPVFPRNLIRSFYRLIDSAKLPRIRFHDLRHTHATMLLKINTNPKIVSDRLGHADIRITLDTYSHLLPGMQREAAEAFEKELFG